MTDDKFQEYIESGQNGGKPTPDDYGKELGGIAFDATDATIEAFEILP